MNMHSMTSLSEVFGGKVLGLKKPIKLDVDDINISKNETKISFKEPKLSINTTGNFDKIFGTKKENISTKNPNTIEGKVFKNVKINGLYNKNITNNNFGTNFSGFNTMLYGNKVNINKGKLFQDFIAKNRSTKLNLQTYNVKEKNKSTGISNKWQPAASAENVSMDNYETYGEQYGDWSGTNISIPKGIQTVGKAIGKGFEAAGVGIATGSKAVVKGFQAVKPGLQEFGQDAKSLAIATGFAESEADRRARLQQEQQLLQLQQLQMQNSYAQGFNPYNFNIVTSPGNVYGYKSPTQKVISGFGMGRTGGPTEENLTRASRIKGAGPASLIYAGYVPSNEPFANKVISSVSLRKPTRAYADVVYESLKSKSQNGENEPDVNLLKTEYQKYSDLPGGPTYPRPAFVPQQIPQQMPQQIPQQMPQQIPQQMPQQIPQQSHQPVVSERSKRVVSYKRGPYRKVKTGNVQYVDSAYTAKPIAYSPSGQPTVQPQYLQGPQQGQLPYKY